MISQIPQEMHWIFWDVDVHSLDLITHADAILARVLEYGRLTDVQWVLKYYGEDQIHNFFRTSAHPLISAKTRCFWRAYFQTGEPWASLPSWRKNSAAPWND